MASKLPARIASTPETRESHNTFLAQTVMTREKAQSVADLARDLVNKLIGDRAEAEQLRAVQTDSGEVPTLIAVHENSVDTYHALCNTEAHLLRLAAYFKE